MAAGRWETVPGLLGLIEAGVSVDDLAGRELVAPVVRSTGFAGEHMTPDERGHIHRLWDWLKGFRRTATLVERATIWVPIAEAWPVPGGSLRLDYEVGTIAEDAAQLTVLGLGFGAASRHSLLTAVRLSGEDAGIGRYALAHLTVHRYVNGRTGQELLSADVDAGGELAEYDSRSLPLQDNPLPGPVEREALAKYGYTVLELQRFTRHDGVAEVTAKREALRRWKFDAGIAVPGVGEPLKLSATCERAESFATTYTLPGGRDYAFCAATGELPVVPLCAPLLPEAATVA